MGKYINGMLHGGKKTKILLWTIVLLIAGALGLIVFSSLQHNLFLFILAIVLGMDALIISQTNTFSDVVLGGENSKIDIDLGIPEDVPDDEIFEHIDEDTLKKVMIAYKVKKDHRMVVIDESNKLKIHQCPAYIWVQHNRFNILVIEREPRKIDFPISSLSYIQYKPKVSVRVDNEYKLFRKDTVIKRAFSKYLPDYHGEDVKYKNLYMVAGDISFTNNSIKHVMDLCPMEFRVQDRVTDSEENNRFFVNAYKAGILLKDNVLTIDKYKLRITNILEDMTESSITNKEFEKTMRDMLINRLVTEEFAVYYTNQRNKNNKK